VEKGYCVVICTARPRHYTTKTAEEVGASPYLISSNASEIYDFISAYNQFCLVLTIQWYIMTWIPFYLTKTPIYVIISKHYKKGKYLKFRGL